MTAAIETRVLTKDFGAQRGLFDLDLEVEEGEVFGYLGPNGAGKTTTIRMLMGLIHPSRGSASIFGLNCQSQAVEVKRHVGYVPGELPQFGGLRGSEIVAYLAGLRGGVDAARVTAIAQRLELDLGRRYREYSRGNKQKLGLLVAFMHRPSLLILDEPTASLDPLNQQTFYDLLSESRQDGATIFLSSHVLSEVEHVCDHVGIIRRGRLVSIARTGMISTAAIGAFSGMLQSLGFQAIVGTSESARQQFGLQMQLLGRQLSYLVPLPVHPETLAGYVQWRAFGFFPVIFGFWALIAGSSAIRGDEDRGHLEMWLASGTSRARVTAARTGAFVIAAAASILIVLLLTGLGATIVGSPLPIEGLLADGAALLAVTVACFALALLIAQFV